ncbi:unnamed protein product [Rotaria magnacalcarata]
MKDDEYRDLCGLAAQYAMPKRRCENSKSEIDVNVDGETFEQTTAIFIHFITAFENVQHQRITTPEKMKYDESTIEPFVTHSFHIVIGELLNKSYYLLVSRDASIESEYIQTEFLPNHRCIFVRYISKRINKERISSILSTTTVSSEESTCTAPKQLCIDVDDTFNDYNKENILD